MAKTDAHDESERHDGRTVAALALVLGAWWALAAAYGARVFTHPGEWLHYEGSNLFHAHRLGTGGGLYRDVLTEGALTFPIYPPGLYVLWAPLVRWTGLAMWPGRLISVVAMTVVLWALFNTCRELSCSRTVSAVAALSLVTFPGNSFLAWGVRPDGPALAFAATAVLVVTRWENRPSASSPLVAGLLAVAMLFTKHNFVPVVAALGIAFLLRDRRAAVRYAITVVGLSGAALLAAQASGPFVQDMVSFAGGRSLHALGDTATGLVSPAPHPGLIVGAAAVLIIGLRATTLVWLAGVVVLLSAVKIGSSLNYGLILFMSSAILVGVALEWLAEHRGPRAVALACAACAAALVPPFIEEVEDRRAELQYVAATQDVEREVVEVLRSHPGRILGDRDDLILRAGATPELEPFVYSQLAEAGEWDPTSLVADLDAHRISMVQTRFDVNGPLIEYQGVPIWPADVVDAVRGSYCLVVRTGIPKLHAPGGLWLYAPCEDRAVAERRQAAESAQSRRGTSAQSRSRS